MSSRERAIDESVTDPYCGGVIGTSVVKLNVMGMEAVRIGCDCSF